MFLSNNFSEQDKTMHNVEILVVEGIIKNLMSSEEEAEMGGLFVNAKEGEEIRLKLEKMGHTKNKTTPIQTDNSTAYGLANYTIKQRGSKAMDMIFHWVKDRFKQKNFLVHCKTGNLNIADYHTTFHSPEHHQKKRPLHIHTP